LSSNSPKGDKALSFISSNIPEGIEIADAMLNFNSKGTLFL